VSGGERWDGFSRSDDVRGASVLCCLNEVLERAYDNRFPTSEGLYLFSNLHSYRGLRLRHISRS